MSEETKAFFLESVKSASLLWCNKAITSDDLFKIIIYYFYYTIHE